MQLSNFKCVNNNRNLFTLFTSADGGKTWALAAMDRVIAGVTGRASALMATGRITHYVITRGEWAAA